MGYNKISFERKFKLTQKEIDILFNIIKTNMMNLGRKVTDNDYHLWSKNLISLLQSKTTYFYIINTNQLPCGFIELVENENSLTLSELQLDSSVKKTRLILTIIEFLFNNKNFKDKDLICFQILKNNDISNRTFLHLGAEKISETEKYNKYVLTRFKVLEYLKKLHKKFSNNNSKA